MYLENCDTVLPMKKQTIVVRKNEIGMSGPAFERDDREREHDVERRSDVRDALEHHLREAQGATAELRRGGGAGCLCSHGNLPDEG